MKATLPQTTGRVEAPRDEEERASRVAPPSLKEHRLSRSPWGFFARTFFGKAVGCFRLGVVGLSFVGLWVVVRSVVEGRVGGCRGLFERGSWRPFFPAAAAPQSIPSWIRLPFGSRPGPSGLTPIILCDRLASARPSQSDRRSAASRVHGPPQTGLARRGLLLRLKKSRCNRHLDLFLLPVSSPSPLGSVVRRSDGTSP